MQTWAVIAVVILVAVTLYGWFYGSQKPIPTTYKVIGTVVGVLFWLGIISLLGGFK